jgi:acetoacetate decarboxylase
MGFVKTREEIARLEHVLKHPRFVGAEMLTIDYLTTNSIVRSILPPGLEPAADPLITAMVGRWRSNCVADFAGGAIYVAARHKDIEAAYVLAMFMDTDQAIMFGRDLFGEPKKRAVSDLRRNGSSIHGYVERCGVRLIDIRAELTTDLGPATAHGANFNIKAVPASDGVGCEDDPYLTLAEFDNTLCVRKEGPGTLLLGSSVHDPLADIKVVQLRKATYIEGDLISRCRTIARLPGKEFVPYLYGRLDDWTALDTENTSTFRTSDFPREARARQ